jgi:uncharacterized membrane protein YdbT with pleckstrin-like domain
MEKLYERLGKKSFLLLLLSNSAGPIIVLILWVGLIILSGLVDTRELAHFFLGSASETNIINNILYMVLFGGFIVEILAIIWAVALTLIDYYSFQFRVGDHAFRLKRGIIHISETAIPYRQIHDVNIFEPLIFRFFRGCKVSILTAANDTAQADGTKDYSECYIPALDKKRAEILREELLKRSNVQEVVHAESKPL